jgi:hypothetical protein
MSQNGKGDADNRVQNRVAFCRNHESSYGKYEKVDGRRTLLRVGADGKLYNPREEVETFISIDPINTTYTDHIDWLQKSKS